MDFIKLAQSFSNPFLDVFFQSVTMMGEEYFIFAVVTLLFWCVDKELAYRLGFAYASGAAVNTSLKEIFHVARPTGEGIRQLRLETATGYSFPSGHTQNAATFWMSVMIQIRRRWLYCAGLLFILLIALSRIYLGLHRPVDVLGGMIIGSAWVFTSNWIFNHAVVNGKRGVFLFCIIPILAGIYLFPTGDYLKASGAFTGLLIGYMAESKYIRFEVKAAPLIQVVKYIAGMAGLMLIKILVKDILPDVPPSHFFRYFLMGVWVTAIAPYLFQLFLNKKRAESTG